MCFCRNKFDKMYVVYIMWDLHPFTLISLVNVLEKITMSISERDGLS